VPVREFILDKKPDEIYEHFVSYFSKLGWRTRREDNVLMVEGSKDVNVWVILVLLALGFLLLWLLLFGVVLWIAAIIYAIVAERHSITIISKDGTYRIIANTDRAFKEARGFMLALNASEIVPSITISIEDMYDKLLARYVAIYGMGGRAALEKRISKLIDKGLSREEAIKRLFEKEIRS